MRGVLWAVTALCLSGCAGYCIQDTATGKDGYLIYEPWPYLLVGKEKGGKPNECTVEIVYLPNRSKSYRVKTWAGFGKADFVFNFQDGWMLKDIQDKSDNRDVLKAVTGLLPKPFGPEGLQGAKDREIWLYRMEFDKSGRVCGLTPIAPSYGSASCDAADMVRSSAPSRPCAPSYPPVGR